MVFEIFPVIASDQFAERKLITQHRAPQSIASMISKRYQASSTIVRYTVHDWEIYPKKDMKLSHNHLLNRLTNY